MAQEIADSKLIDTWGSSGTKIEPDISKIIEGWQLGEQPPHEYMNWLQNTFGSKLNHILKNGVASWNNETEYLAGSSVQHNGNVWLCKTTNTNSEPTGLNANWEKLAISKDLTVTVDTLANLKSISYPSNTVWASGYHTKNDGAFGSHIFRLKGVKTTETDNGGTVIIATIGGTDYVYELHFDGAVNVKWFGAKGDGVTDDTDSLIRALTAIDEAIIDGGNLKYRYESIEAIPTKISRLQNTKIVSLNASRFINLIENIDFSIDNCTFDNNRGSYVEQWNKFSSENGIDSIQPSITSYIYNSVSNSRTIKISNCNFTNMFNASCITLAGNGDFYYSNLTFNNIANKTFHSYHITKGVGNSYADNITVDSCGKLPNSFLYHNGTTTTVNYGDVNMPMPQGSFGNIVTFGNYFASNMYFKNYASTAITFDRNGKAFGNNISVVNDDNKMVSNNPSGAIWDEFCDEFYLNNFSIIISARGLDIGESSAVEIAKNSGKISVLSNGNIDTSSANILRTIRHSSGGNNILMIENIGIISRNTVESVISNGYLSSATIKDRITINNCSIKGYKLYLSPSSILSITNSRIDLVFNEFDNYDNTVVGISNLTDSILFTNTTFLTSTPRVAITPVASMVCSNCNFYSGSFANGVNINKLTIDTCYIVGRLVIVSCYSFKLSNSTVTRRIEFSNGASGAFINITNNVIGNDEGVYTIYNLSNNFLAGTITGNTILIKTGTVGAGYVNTVPNMIDANNNKLTLNYTL